MSSGMKCYNCGKGIMIGHSVSHAKNRTRKIFKPNLHWARIGVSGQSLRVRLCTKCLRQLKSPKVKSRNVNTEVAQNTPVAPVV